jgi:putative transposase
MLLRWLSLEKKARCRTDSEHRPWVAVHGSLIRQEVGGGSGIVPSMGRAGSALDNAISESFVASLKCELLHGHRFLDREAARTAVFDYIEGFYNRVRRHSSVGYVSPSEYEQATIKEVAVP